LLIPLAANSRVLADHHAEGEATPLETIKAQFGDRALTKPFAMTVRFTVKADQRDSFIEAMKLAITKTREEEANTRYQLVYSSSDENAFVLHEQWKNFEGLSAHFETEHLKQLLGSLETSLEAPPEMEVYFPVPLRRKR
ncbi:MAG: putative quinol monooxygenase, partial [Planctomycetota bacterium]